MLLIENYDSYVIFQHFWAYNFLKRSSSVIVSRPFLWPWLSFLALYSAVPPFLPSRQPCEIILFPKCTTMIYYFSVINFLFFFLILLFCLCQIPNYPSKFNSRITTWLCLSLVGFIASFSLNEYYRKIVPLACYYHNY